MPSEFAQCLAALQEGEVIAYATEAVYGLGCDPDNQSAVQQLLALKRRPIAKGVIVVAGELQQLRRWVDVDAIATAYPHVLQSWPGPYTWLLPCKPATPQYLTGQYNTLAVRVSAHPGIQQLCSAFGRGIVSTSANPSGEEPARSAEQAQAYFPTLKVLQGQIDNVAQPSMIRDAQTQAVIRS